MVDPVVCCVVCWKSNKPKQKIDGMEIFAEERVEQAVEYYLG